MNFLKRFCLMVVVSLATQAFAFANYPLSSIPFISETQTGQDFIHSLQSQEQHCRLFAEQQLFLEREAKYSYQRILVFNQAHDLTMKLFYQVRLQMIQHFLQQLTTIFKNEYEGGGSLDERPIQCQFNRRDQILRIQLKRDESFKLFLRSVNEPQLFDPRNYEEETFIQLKNSMSKRQLFVVASKVSTTIAASYMFFARLARPLASLSKSNFLRPLPILIQKRGPIVLMALGTISYELIKDEAFKEYYGDFSDRSPEALWTRTMALIYYNLSSDLGPEVVEAFSNLQSKRKAALLRGLR